jgi:hypothetical protein
MNPAPRAVRLSAVLWSVAMAAGVFETCLVVFSADRIGGDIVAGALFRVAVFALAALLIVRLRGGRNWARLALTVMLSGLGLLSLVIGPVEWLADGNSLPAAIERMTVLSGTFALSRIVHIVAVPAATVLMYRPAANVWFRRLPAEAAAA